MNSYSGTTLRRSLAGVMIAILFSISSFLTVAAPAYTVVSPASDVAAIA